MNRYLFGKNHLWCGDLFSFEYYVAYEFVGLVDGIGFLGLLIFHFLNFKSDKPSMQLYADDEEDDGAE